jgi:hypothetical protein
MTNIKIKDYFSKVCNEEKRKTIIFLLKKSCKSNLATSKSDFL